MKGIASLLGHHQITSIEEMRKGLVFPPAHHFRITLPKTSSSQSRSQHGPSRSFRSFRGLSIAETSSKKRKSPESEAGSSRPSRSYSQKSTLEDQGAEGPENTQTTSLYSSGNGSFENRLFCCLVISPAGRAINKYGSITELLTALCDAIKAHKSLYIQGGILHRDISENNIIIMDPEKTGGFTGMLIDLDLAKAVDSARSGARHQTGTMEFMAIDVLLGCSHTYRHDLESFFYVLLWICARRGWKDSPPKNSALTKWYSGTFDEIANAKLGHMTKSENKGFGFILREFSRGFDPVKPLCKALWDILFSYTSEGMFMGTPKEPEVFYGSIIEAFDEAIADIVDGEASK